MATPSVVVAGGLPTLSGGLPHPHVMTAADLKAAAQAKANAQSHADSQAVAAQYPAFAVIVSAVREAMYAAQRTAEIKFDAEMAKDATVGYRLGFQLQSAGGDPRYSHVWDGTHVPFGGYSQAEPQGWPFAKWMGRLHSLRDPTLAWAYVEKNNPPKGPKPPGYQGGALVEWKDIMGGRKETATVYMEMLRTMRDAARRYIDDVPARWAYIKNDAITVGIAIKTDGGKVHSLAKDAPLWVDAFKAIKADPLVMAKAISTWKGQRAEVLANVRNLKSGVAAALGAQMAKASAAADAEVHPAGTQTGRGSKNPAAPPTDAAASGDVFAWLAANLGTIIMLGGLAFLVYWLAVRKAPAGE